MKISNIERFAINDGPGIRTTVFLQGCPLRCEWCANPETQNTQMQIMHFDNKCTGCGKCKVNCPEGAIEIVSGNAHIDRDKCIKCGKCSSACMYEAMKLSGKDMSTDEIFDIIIRDKDYYDCSGGGVTFSGGEALLYADLLVPLFNKCHQTGINVAVETCGNISSKLIEFSFHNIDLFLFDLKTLSDDKMKKYTKGDLGIIRKNLEWIANNDAKKIELRVPVIPGFNHTINDIKKILEYAFKLGIKKIDFLPYHTLGIAKYNQLGMSYLFPVKESLRDEDLYEYKEMAVEMGFEASIGG